MAVAQGSIEKLDGASGQSYLGAKPGLSFKGPQVEPGSPVERPGLRHGDVLVVIDGVQLHGSTQVRNHVGRKRVGRRLP